MITTLSILPSLSYHVSFDLIISSFNRFVYLFGFMTSKVASHFSSYMTFNNLITLQVIHNQQNRASTLRNLMEKLILGINTVSRISFLVNTVSILTNFESS